MNRLTRQNFLGGCGAAIALSGCSRTAAAGSGYAVLSEDGEPLRAAFNRAANSVRVVAIVSPT
jgi:hypothetical protein